MFIFFCRDPEVSVYNVSVNESYILNVDTIYRNGENLLWKIPLPNTAWYMSTTFVKNYVMFFSLFIVKQLLPAFILDTFLSIAGQEKV